VEGAFRVEPFYGVETVTSRVVELALPQPSVVVSFTV
jgi:hypothetical protein